MSGLSFYADYVRLVAALEKRFAVSHWRCGDLDLWPLARFDLYLDMARAAAGEPAPSPRALPARLAGRTLQPLRNLWRMRDDRARLLLRPKPSYAAFLGDGVSLDKYDDGFDDRCGEPLMAALESQGRSVFAMTAGDLSRRLRRSAFAANVVQAWGSLLAPLAAARPVLPDHARLLDFLGAEAVSAPSLSRRALAGRGSQVLGEALLFGRMLAKVAPRLAFVVSWYAGLGPSFLLACRRRGIFSVALQHAPLAGAPMAYAPYGARPKEGYATWPDAIWAWSEEDLGALTKTFGDACHPIVGGALQSSRLPANAQALQRWDGMFGGSFRREILVALQPLPGYGEIWHALAAIISSAPADWRWWLRRHPASRPEQDLAYGPLLSLRCAQVAIAEAAMPLPHLLRHCHATVSVASGVAAEAAAAGVPAFFLSPDALGPFAGLIAKGAARLIAADRLTDAIAALPERKASAAPAAPDIETVLAQLQSLARVTA